MEAEIARATQALVDTDWATEWVARQMQRKHNDSSERWDKRAENFGNVLVPGEYSAQFIERLALRPGDVAFDMGCGNGAIAIPLAQAGYKVVARDFSPRMLERLLEAAQTTGTTALIDAARMSWEDDWAAAGLEERMVDVAFASRSVITKDLGESLTKLSRIARRHACVTVSIGYTPAMSSTLLLDLGVSRVHAYDYVYTFNILVQLGYKPEVSYIVNDRVVVFDTLEEGIERFGQQLEHAHTYCDAAELARAAEALPAWVRERMVENENAGQPDRHGDVQGRYKVCIPGDIRWAFVKWDV